MTYRAISCHTNPAQAGIERRVAPGFRRDQRVNFRNQNRNKLEDHYSCFPFSTIDLLQVIADLGMIAWNDL